MLQRSPRKGAVVHIVEISDRRAMQELYPKAYYDALEEGAEGEDCGEKLEDGKEDAGLYGCPFRWMCCAGYEDEGKGCGGHWGCD